MTTRVSPTKRLAALLLAVLLAFSTLACAKEEVKTYQSQLDLGVRFLTDGNYEEAIIAFQAAIEIEPKNAEAYLSLAEVYLAMGDVDAAIDVLIDALAAVDDVTEVESMLALLTGEPDAEPEPEPEPEPIATLIVSVSSQAELDALAQREDAEMIAIFSAGGEITDISALSALTNLRELSLWRRGVSDISALRGLTKLTYLNLEINNISDISALSGLVNLESLNLDGNTISDISALSGLTKLTWLNLGSDYGGSGGTRNEISDISALRGLTNLVTLDLGYCKNITDISALSGLTKLEKLELNNNSISDISALGGLTNLTELNLRGNGDLTQAQVDALQAQLPNCEIEF